MPAYPRSSVLQHYGFFDIAFGAAIIAAALAFLVFMQITTGTGNLQSYGLSVEVPDADSLKPGSDVRLHGIKVGSVSDMSLAAGNHSAILKLSVRDDLDLPAGSSFSVTSSPMSGSYLAITPGRGPATIPRNSLVPRPAPPRTGSPGV